MTLHDEEHRRKNIRIQGYDYARAGLYFLTVVVQNRLHLFGRVVNGEMILNDAGRMIEKWYREIENKFPDKRCREMVVMPNHMHCIIENMGMDNIPSTDVHVTGMGMNITEMDTDTHVTGTNMGTDTNTDAHVAFRDTHVAYGDAHVGASRKPASRNNSAPRNNPASRKPVSRNNAISRNG